VKVYLLIAEDGTPAFHFRAPRVDRRDDATVHGGLRGWLERKSKSLKASWEHADHGVTARVKHVWEWLHRRMPADEAALARLRSAATIEVHHPATLSCDEARALWMAYLASRRRRHLPWLGVNTLVSPLSVVLAPLPGPNVVGYWFVYRAVRDLLAFLGLRHALGTHVETTFHPNDSPEQALRLDHGAELVVGESV